MTTEGTNFQIDGGVLDGVSFPEIYADNFDMTWIPGEDHMYVRNRLDSFQLYNNSATLDGFIDVNKTGVFGGGTMSTRGFTTESQDFTFSEQDLLAKNSTFEMASSNPAKPLLRGDDIRLEFDFNRDIAEMSPEIEGLVQTSNNLARVLVKNGELVILCLTRGSVNTERDDLATAIAAGIELTGADVGIAGQYPGWQPAPSSAIVKLLSSLYEELFDEPANVAACHAGLECGILGTNYPDVEMISFGPNIRGAHSPDERCQVSSVQKYWNFLLETLKRIPKK